MLVEFCTKNFMSIKDEARLSLVARPSGDRRATHLVTPRHHRGVPVPLVRSAAVYGPNAAGKTNLLLALSAMQATVMSSFQMTNRLPMVPFAFDPALESEPSILEVVFVLDGIRYQYGFSATSSVVIDEWLFAWPRGRVQTWFERSGEQFEFGQKLLGPKHIWKKSTRPDALFLSTAVALNSKQLKPVFDWFRKSLHIVPIGEWINAFTTERCRRDSRTDGINKEHIVDFLKKSDLSISDIRVRDKEVTTEEMSDEFSHILSEKIKENLVGKKIPEVAFVHNVGENAEFELNIGVESRGTQRIFALAGPWLDVLREGSTLVVDELEQSLHPTLVRFLVGCFHNPMLNERGAQLIFTTHNTSILDQNVFRRDQIWFCERNDAQETQLFPLTQFHPRKKHENLERSYLAGRYGALPYVRSASSLVE